MDGVIAFPADLHREPRFDLAAFVAAHEHKDQLRLITCGSVDDGKSTLIGRLLWETRVVADDQMAAVEAASRRHGTQGEAIDLALLLDGLAAEREQGITIDVAYRFFTTERRRFVIADTPGHEQYTRNMATGASTAELAVLLVDARTGVKPQTRRHALIASMLRVRHVVVAINKMDLVGWDEAVAARIGADVGRVCDGLGFDSVVTIPVSALTGENVATRGAAAPWYRGPTLLEHLETVPVTPQVTAPFRLPVQLVSRPNSEFRGFSGELAEGSLQVGDAVSVLPARQQASVARILSPDGDVLQARAGDAVTVLLDREIDVSRGDVLADPASPARVSRHVRARALWFDETAGPVGSTYLLKLGTRTVTARIERIAGKVVLETMQTETASSIAMNDIVDIELTLERPIAFDSYAESRTMGGFVLIDPETFDTVALGLMQGEVIVEGGPVKETWHRSAFKAVSYRALGSTATAGLAFAMTGNVSASLVIGGGDALLKMGLYYLHERVWNHIPLGRLQRIRIAQAG